MKDKTNKPRWGLLNFEALGQMAQVLTDNAEKHGGDRAWRQTPNAREQYFDALMRHINQYRQGVTTDPDDGADVLVKIMINAMILFDLEDYAPEYDYLGIIYQ